MASRSITLEAIFGYARYGEVQNDGLPVYAKSVFLQMNYIK
jgi:hypothetical protein